MVDTEEKDRWQILLEDVKIRRKSGECSFFKS